MLIADQQRPDLLHAEAALEIGVVRAVGGLVVAPVLLIGVRRLVGQEELLGQLDLSGETGTEGRRPEGAEGVVVRVDQIDEADRLQELPGLVADIEEMRAGAEVASPCRTLVSEDPVDLPDVDVLEEKLLEAEVRPESSCVEGLFVLSPSHVSDECCRVADDALAADLNEEAVLIVFQVGLVEFRVVGVGVKSLLKTIDRLCWI